MGYEFSLDKRKTVILIILFSVQAVLFFTAGLLTGWMTVRNEASASHVSSEIVKPEPVSEVKEKKEESAEKVPEVAAEDKTAGEQPKLPLEPEAYTEAAPPAEEKPLQPEVLFSVEAASFVSRNSALNMIADLKKKKYEACLVKMWDSQDPEKAWYVVQIGDFAEREKAITAAEDFKQKEGIVTVVRSMSAEMLKERKDCGDKSETAGKGA